MLTFCFYRTSYCKHTYRTAAMYFLSPLLLPLPPQPPRCPRYKRLFSFRLSREGRVLRAMPVRGSRQADVAVAVAAARSRIDWSPERLVATFPWGGFLSEGSFKKVNKPPPCFYFVSFNVGVSSFFSRRTCSFEVGSKWGVSRCCLWAGFVVFWSRYLLTSRWQLLVSLPVPVLCLINTPVFSLNVRHHSVW